MTQKTIECRQEILDIFMSEIPIESQEYSARVLIAQLVKSISLDDYHAIGILETVKQDLYHQMDSSEGINFNSN